MLWANFCIVECWQVASVIWRKGYVLRTFVSIPHALIYAQKISLTISLNPIAFKKIEELGIEEFSMVAY